MDTSSQNNIEYVTKVIGDVLIETWKLKGEKFSIIHEKRSDNYHSMTQINVSGDRYFIDSTGKEVWNKYDDDGNLIHTRDSSGQENWYKYDGNNRLAYIVNSDGYVKTINTK